MTNTPRQRLLMTRTPSRGVQWRKFRVEALKARGNSAIKNSLTVGGMSGSSAPAWSAKREISLQNAMVLDSPVADHPAYAARSRLDRPRQPGSRDRSHCAASMLHGTLRGTSRVPGVLDDRHILTWSINGEQVTRIPNSARQTAAVLNTMRLFWLPFGLPFGASKGVPEPKSTANFKQGRSVEGGRREGATTRERSTSHLTARSPRAANRNSLTRG
ncbi:uncharacterized protein B0H64DRAFT_369136 [Chaetomium fimeti]|uniref:Uncharacterized protein n=1 Tax=Chaetomium fimeti TaxID=1854472 RepID=A0AAE0HP56_9PEZI|nr:hypothetical protein B0H64DRAFT_369136 [Chaetomium fimeti]